MMVGDLMTVEEVTTWSGPLRRGHNGADEETEEQGGRSWDTFGEQKNAFHSFVRRLVANLRQKILTKSTKIATKTVVLCVFATTK